MIQIEISRKKGISSIADETGCLSINPGKARRLLKSKRSCRLSLDVIGPGEARRLSLDVISPEIGYSSVNMSPGMVHRLLEHNKSCGLSECKRSLGVVCRFIECNISQRLSEWKISRTQVVQM